MLAPTENQPLYRSIHTERELKTRWGIVTLAVPTVQEIDKLYALEFVEGVPPSPDQQVLINFAQDPNKSLLLNDAMIGLGDQIIALRSASAFARHFPNRRFYLAPDMAVQLASLVLPPNLIHACAAESVPSTTESAWFYDHDQHLYWHQKSVPASKDHSVMYMLKLGGANINLDTYYQSILHFNSEFVDQHPPTSDLLIIPDALEGDGKFNQYRSFKSIPPEKWSEIFSHLDPKLKMAIVMGTAHPAYCNDVIGAALQAGHTNVQVVQGSLDDVVNAVLTTRKFVGMDSGTTHIAAEVVKAARQVGREIQFRELFNAGVSFGKYGIAGESFHTLIYRAEDDDLDGIDSKAVVDFIAA